MSEEQNRIALVTGASRGIGKAIALRLADAGYTVLGTATSESGAEAISGYLSEKGGKGYCLNVTDQDSIDSVLNQIKEAYGAPTILVNNAGITRDNIMLRMKQDEWDDVIDTNLSSVYRMAKACLRGMSKGRWGRVVNISSVVGAMGNPGQANYAAAKAGMEGFTRAMAREFGSRNITVNAVAPGFIDTDMTKELPEANKEAMLAQIPA
ncbi:MAG: 3-oxoacyl-ACP reductase FabG, partial [Pseudomonadales bacterium]|nr:3-oxoacyl-ACP reductase FabG [Pseudomonadales bacterium]